MKLKLQVRQRRKFKDWRKLQLKKRLKLMQQLPQQRRKELNKLKLRQKEKDYKQRLPLHLLKKLQD